jgi:uncharacterized damage-inducible protein DinB
LEADHHLQRIEILRQQVYDLLAAAPDDALNWVPDGGEGADRFNSLAALAAHIAGTEHYWISEVIGQQPSVRDRDAEFAAKAVNNRPLLSLLEKTGGDSREVFVKLSESDLNRTVHVDGETPTIRWILMQVASHTATHLGHMQITYQLWNNGKMFKDVRWKSMLPGKTKA